MPNQLKRFLTSNCIYEVFQSGFKLNDIYLSTDSGDSGSYSFRFIGCFWYHRPLLTIIIKLESRVGLEANFLKWFHHTCLIERFSWNWLIVPLPLRHSTRLYFSSLSIFSKHATSAKTRRVYLFLHRWYSNLSTNQKKQFHCDYFSSAMFRGG